MTEPTTSKPTASRLEPAKPGIVERVQAARMRLRARLGDAPHPSVLVERGIRVRMRDGVELDTHRWSPHDEPAPVVIVRTPYGLDGTGPMARLLAERGVHVIVQSCRGTFDSDGEPTMLAQEREDGLDAHAWVREQPWCDGTVHTWGPSYVGLTQWAVVDDEPGIASMVVIVSSRSFFDGVVYPSGGFAAETGLTWITALDMQEKPVPSQLARLAVAKSRLRRAATTVPPSQGAFEATGVDSPMWRDWLSHSHGDDAYWQARTYAQRIEAIPPVTLVAGWMDLFLVEQVADFRALQAAGRRVRLVVGDWTHMDDDPGIEGLAAMAEQVADLDAAFAGPAVRYAMTGVRGKDARRTAETWPPPATERVLHLDADERLADVPGGGTTTYRYDPADPTPNAGGRSLSPFEAGRRSQRRREERDDVVLWTSDALASSLDVVGDPVVRLRLATDAPVPDVFARLTEVDAAGTSTTITDGFLRLPAGEPGEARDVEVTLAPCAHRVAVGSRLRLQVSSAAHPLFLRNPGGVDPMTDDPPLTPSTQTIEHAGSTLTLPIA